MKIVVLYAVNLIYRPGKGALRRMAIRTWARIATGVQFEKGIFRIFVGNVCVLIFSGYTDRPCSIGHFMLY
jgi:hypothetical protein